MVRSPARLLDSLSEVQTTMKSLLVQTSKLRDVDDIVDFSVLQNTNRKIENLLEVAAEYMDMLHRRQATTTNRLEKTPLDRSVSLKRQLVSINLLSQLALRVLVSISAAGDFDCRGPKRGSLGRWGCGPRFASAPPSGGIHLQQYT